MRVPEGQVPVHMDYAMRLTGRAEPRICVLNTANGDDPQWALRMYDRFAGRSARLSHLALFPMPNVADPEDLLLSQDVIFVGGGSVAHPAGSATCAATPRCPRARDLAALAHEPAAWSQDLTAMAQSARSFSSVSGWRASPSARV